MGYDYCGVDSQGRDIGNEVFADCDKEGCDSVIRRNHDSACGGQHGGDLFGCGRYYCQPHLNLVPTSDMSAVKLCDECATKLLKDQPKIHI